MGFQRLIDILKQARERNPVFSRRLEEAEALARWEKAVGPAIAKNSRAIRVQDHVLWVEVDHPIWRQELHLRKKQILDILNQKASALPVPKSQASAVVIEDILFLEPKRPVKGSR